MNKSIFCVSIIILSMLNDDVFGARILFHTPTPSYSHNAVYHPIIMEMARRGHDVVSISTHPIDLSNENVTITQVDVSSYNKLWEQSFERGTKDMTIGEIIWLHLTVMNGFADMQLSHPAVSKMIHNQSEHFDLIVVETVFYEAIFGWSYRFNAPMVGIVSVDGLYNVHDLVGNPAHPYLYNSLALEFLTGPDATFLQRMQALYVAGLCRLYNYIYNEYYTEPVLRKHFGENAPSLPELAKNMSLIIVNQNEIFNQRPKVPTFIYMNMMHIRPPRPLPQDLYNFLEESSEGVVYFSLGSNVKSSRLRKETLDIFIEVFSQLSVKVLWKFEREELPGRPSNVKLCQWCPQQDILAHKNVKLFIMQGGVQSIEEGVYYKVPIIGIPMLVDQTYNIKLLIKKEVAEIMEFDALNANHLIKLINKMIFDSSYKTKMDKLSELVQDQLTNPLERVTWWLEYVLRHRGAAHLRTPQLPWYLVLMLDAVAVVLLILFVATCLICRLSKLAREHTGALLSAEKLKAH